MHHKNISELANRASLKIYVDNDTVVIKHKFNLVDKTNWGLLFFLLAGAFLIVAPLAKAADTASKLMGIVLGLTLFIASLLTIIKQVADGIRMSENILRLRYNLKVTNIQLGEFMKVKMKTEQFKIRRVSALDSDFIVVSHYLQHMNKEILILRFKMENKFSDEANVLGAEISRVLNNKIQKFN